MFKFKIFIILIILKISLFQEGITKPNLIEKGKEYGHDLTDPEDNFFHDICLNFRYIKKDLTLDYRRKYYFFPSNINNPLNLKLLNQRPIRNNSNDCFLSNSASGLFSNITVLCFFPIFLIQFLLLSYVLILKLKDSINNTPYKKVMKNKNKLKKEKKNDKQSTYSEFIPEVTINDISETLQKIKEPEQNEKNEQNGIIDMNKSNQKLRSVNDNEININQQNSLEPLNNNKNKKENGQKNNDENSEPSPAKEKSIENYTFGVQFGKGYKFSDGANIKNDKINNKIIEDNIKKKDNNNNIKKKEKNIEKKEDKMKRIKYVYEQINQNKRKLNIKKSDMNADTPIIIPTKKNIEKLYVREEYFYFGYLLARIEDKRTIFQIYIDLLEQCQIFFKFLNTPFNIYEDRKLQIVYYLTKINIYFLFNCLLIKSSVINDIYDGKNKFKNDFYRSILATISTYGIGLIFYYLTNIKKQLIKRRYKLVNIKINDSRLNGEFVRFSLNFCLNFFFNKLILLTIVFLFIFFYSSYICFSFCNVYYYTQILLLKCVLLSITISQVIPIFACWIPAILRNKAIQKKKAKLYDLSKIIELLFIPW